MPYLDNTGVEYLVGDLKEKTDAAYQATLVSGTNIKTVNGNSLLGSGNLIIEGGGSDVSVTQIQTTGTKIATVTVDNVGTDLYAPTPQTYSALTTQEIEDAVDAAFAYLLIKDSSASTDVEFYSEVSESGTYLIPSNIITEAIGGATVYITFATLGMTELVVKEQATQTTVSTTYIGYTENAGLAVFEMTMPEDNIVASVDSSGPPMPF